MPIDRETLRQLSHLVRPLATRVANSLARGVVHLVDDSKKMQRVQLGVLADEDVEGDTGAEHFQPYGFTSVPLPKDSSGAPEPVVAFPNGDRGHPLVVVIADRRYRPTSSPAGEVVLYTDEGDTIRLGRSHVITIATSGTIKLGSSSAADKAIKGSTRDTAEQTFLAALNTYVLAVKTIADPTNAFTPAFTAAITAFKSAITAALSSKVKLE